MLWHWAWPRAIEPWSHKTWTLSATTCQLFQSGIILYSYSGLPSSSVSPSVPYGRCAAVSWMSWDVPTYMCPVYPSLRPSRTVYRLYSPRLIVVWVRRLWIGRRCTAKLHVERPSLCGPIWTTSKFSLMAKYTFGFGTVQLIETNVFFLGTPSMKHAQIWTWFWFNDNMNVGCANVYK